MDSTLTRVSVEGNLSEHESTRVEPDGLAAD